MPITSYYIGNDFFDRQYAECSVCRNTYRLVDTFYVHCSGKSHAEPTGFPRFASNEKIGDEVFKLTCLTRRYCIQKERPVPKHESMSLLPKKRPNNKISQTKSTPCFPSEIAPPKFHIAYQNWCLGKQCISFQLWLSSWGYMNLVKNFRRVYRGWGSSPPLDNQPGCRFAFATVPMYAPMEARMSFAQCWRRWHPFERRGSPKGPSGWRLTCWTSKNLNFFGLEDGFPIEIVSF